MDSVGKQRPRIERADQLPVHTYPVPNSVTALFQNDALLWGLVDALVADLTSDTEKFDVRDKATLREYLDTLGQAAILRKELDRGLAYFAQIKVLEEKPAAIELSGLTSGAVVAARRSPSDPRGEFARQFRAHLAGTHYDVVQTDLKRMKGELEILTPEVMMGLVRENMDPPARSGRVSKTVAMGIVHTVFVMREVLPYKDDIISLLREAIDSHHVEKVDIWAGRTVDLTGESNLTPVPIAVWDSGVDAAQFSKVIWTNPNDPVDAHGIGWDWNGERIHRTLRELDVPPEKVELGKRYIKGLFDLQYNVESREAEEFRRVTSQLAAHELRPLFETVALYGMYGHGTHVAGIVASGNPAIRLVAILMEFPYGMTPPKLTFEWAERQARCVEESIAFLKRHGVRAVNMSWGLSPSEFERALEYHDLGGDAEARHALASRMLDRIAAAFRRAMAEAPEILFVAACGNANNDARFTEFIPSAIDLPNTITVGAVDIAGDEAAFTSYGSAALYANGYEVDSLVPGGDHQSWSGTSMAAPQVTNLAAKLLAKHPGLPTDQLRRLILEGTDAKSIGGDRTIRLLNAKRSLELAAQEGRGR
jgi:subtilisin family serine protease